MNRFAFFESGDSDIPFEDVAALLDVDRFPFAMVGACKQQGEVVYIDVEKVDVD